MNANAKDRLFALGAVAASLYLGWESFGYPAKSALFPRALSVLLGLLGVGYFLRLSLRARAVSREPSGEAVRERCETVSYGSDSQALRYAAFVFGAIVAYGLTVALINYEAATALFLAVTMRALGFRRPVLVAVVSLTITGLLYGIFFHLLGVGRPDSVFLS